MNTQYVAAGAALGVLVLGLVLAFGVRTWAHHRATGSTGFRGISGRPGSPEWWGGVLFAVALLLALAAPVLVLAGVLTPVAVPAAVLVAGLLVALGGLVLTVLAQRAMGRSWRIGVDESERTELVARGPFRWVRNPIFTGMVAVTAGVALLVPTAVAALGCLCLAVAVHLQVRMAEEPYLERVHGAAYARYRAATGRFLPRLTR